MDGGTLSDMLSAMELTREERQLLSAGVSQWAGPARPSRVLAGALGMASIEALIDEGDRLCSKLRSDEPLSDEECVFALVSTELAFASDRWGAGVEWETVTGYTDAETISRLRLLQRKMVGVGTWPWP